MENDVKKFFSQTKQKTEIFTRNRVKTLLTIIVVITSLLCIGITVNTTVNTINYFTDSNHQIKSEQFDISAKMVETNNIKNVIFNHKFTPEVKLSLTRLSLKEIFVPNYKSKIFTEFFLDME